jgi:hypothetical protein
LIAALVVGGRDRGLSLDVEYVDVLNSVERALSNSVIVTPTVDRIDPAPFLRLIAVASGADALIERLGT